MRSRRGRRRGGAGQALTRGSATQVIDPGPGQFVADGGVHRGLLGGAGVFYSEDASKAVRRVSGDCPVFGRGDALDSGRSRLRIPRSAKAPSGCRAEASRTGGAGGRWRRPRRGCQGSSRMSSCSNSLARASPRHPAGRALRIPEQPGQLPSRFARQQRSHPCCAELTHERAEHGGERRERQAVRAELEAAAQQHPSTRGARPGGELGHQAGLPHPGLPADHDGGRAAAAHLTQRRLQHGELAGAADQNRTRHPRFHTSKHASYRARWRARDGRRCAQASGVRISIRWPSGPSPSRPAPAIGIGHGYPGA